MKLSCQLSQASQQSTIINGVVILLFIKFNVVLIISANLRSAECTDIDCVHLSIAVVVSREEFWDSMGNV